MSFGCLGLKPADLWEITLGNLLDMIQGYHYKQYIESRKDAQHAMFVAAAFSGKINNIEQLCGKWVDGRVMSITEANDYYTELAAKRKRAREDGTDK